MEPTTQQPPAIELDTSVRLSDGRILAYTDLGPRAAPIVMYFHGAPSSRLDLVLLGLADVFTEMNIRVVSPERPGYGGSSPKPGRRLENWPTDVAALADHLGVERFAVIGVSSGGPYTVACAALLPDRVAGLGVIAGVTDMAWDGAWDGLLEHEAALMRLGDEASAVTWCEEHLGPDGSGFVEEFSDLPDVDAQVLQDEAFAAAFATTMSEFAKGWAASPKTSPCRADRGRSTPPPSPRRLESSTAKPTRSCRSPTDATPPT
jgi:pimeloyl-ACP methyl ester carboxylesterase